MPKERYQRGSPENLATESRERVSELAKQYGIDIPVNQIETNGYWYRFNVGPWRVGLVDQSNRVMGEVFYVPQDSELLEELEKDGMLEKIERGGRDLEHKGNEMTGEYVEGVGIKLKGELTPPPKLIAEMLHRAEFYVELPLSEMLKKVFQRYQGQSEQNKSFPQALFGITINRINKQLAAEKGALGLKETQTSQDLMSGLRSRPLGHLPSLESMHRKEEGESQKFNSITDRDPKISREKILEEMERYRNSRK